MVGRIDCGRRGASDLDGPRGVRLREDAARSEWVLLAPERAMKLDPIAAAILQEVDGEKDLAGIVATLVEKYNAPADQIGKDVKAFLSGLLEKRMLELKPS